MGRGAALERAQATADMFVFGNDLADQIPKTIRVIEFTQVAELVHDDVIGNIGGQKYYFVIEIQVPFFRTAPPSRLVILDEYFADAELVHRIEMLYALVHQSARMFTHFHVLPPIPSHPEHRELVFELDRTTKRWIEPRFDGFAREHFLHRIMHRALLYRLLRLKRVHKTAMEYELHIAIE